MKFKLLRFCDLGAKAFLLFTNWLGSGKTPADPYQPIMQVANRAGETVLFAPIELVYVLGNVTVNPAAQKHELAEAGDALNAELTRMAQQSGATKVLVTLPAHVQESSAYTLRVAEREIPATVNKQFDMKQHGPLVTRFVH